MNLRRNIRQIVDFLDNTSVMVADENMQVVYKTCYVFGCIPCFTNQATYSRSKFCKSMINSE